MKINNQKKWKLNLLFCIQCKFPNFYFCKFYIFVFLYFHLSIWLLNCLIILLFYCFIVPWLAFIFQENPISDECHDLFDTSLGIEFVLLASISVPCWEPVSIISMSFRNRIVNECSNYCFIGFYLNGLTYFSQVPRLFQNN